mmetsp:Transcript_4182/g.17173  ORF Transcript_4182/g.17173 Transcript_4182/m.17173 type:complete len:402 (-) Transcript_4182:759-1964(-)
MARSGEGARNGGTELQRTPLAGHRGGAGAAEDVRVAHQTAEVGAAEGDRRTERRGGRARARLQGREPGRLHRGRRRRAGEKDVARRAPAAVVDDDRRGETHETLRDPSAPGATAAAADCAAAAADDDDDRGETNETLRDQRGRGRRASQTAPGAQATAGDARRGVHGHERAHGQGQGDGDARRAPRGLRREPTPIKDDGHWRRVITLGRVGRGDDGDGRDDAVDGNSLAGDEGDGGRAVPPAARQAARGLAPAGARQEGRDPGAPRRVLPVQSRSRVRADLAGGSAQGVPAVEAARGAAAVQAVRERGAGGAEPGQERRRGLRHAHGDDQSTDFPRGRRRTRHDAKDGRVLRVRGVGYSPHDRVGVPAHGGEARDPVPGRRPGGDVLLSKLFPRVRGDLES